MIMAIIGGILVLVGTFIMWFASASGNSDFMTLYDLIDIESEFAYGYLIPIAGIIAIVMAPIAFMMQNRNIATVVAVFGLLAFLFAILVPLHWGSMNNDIASAFYISESFYGTTITSIYLGGFIAIIGGILTMVAGLNMAKAIKKEQGSPYGQYTPPPQPPGYY